MEFENRPWKLDVDNLWWNKNRIQCRDDLLTHFKAGKGNAHLTGMKGAGKTTLAMYLAKKLDAPVIRMTDDIPPKEEDYTVQPLIIDEAQKISQEERAELRKNNPRILMVSVADLSDDGYDLVCKVENMTYKEMVSYVNYHGHLDDFTEDGLKELFKATRGITRLVNLICRTALEKDELILDKRVIEHVAKKIYKLRYK